MPMFTKLHSIRSSLPFSFTSTHRSSSSSPILGEMHQPTALSHSRSHVSITSLPQQQQQRQWILPPSSSPQCSQRHRTTSTPAIGFTETLRMMSKQAQQDRFDDVFGSFFFTDKRCRDRAIFMAARLMHNLGYDVVQQYPPTHPFWKTVIDRFYTLNCLLFVVPSNERVRTNYFAALEQHMTGNEAGQHLKGKRGGMEIYFAICYATIQHDLTASLNHSYETDGTIGFLEHTRQIVEHCLDSENKLGHAERDAMYSFHSLRAGLQHCDPVAVVIDDDDSLLAILQNAILTNKNMTKQPYVNPFEDEACIVDSDDE